MLELPENDWFDDYLNTELPDNEDEEEIAYITGEYDEEYDAHRTCPICNGTGTGLDDCEECDHCDGMGYEWWLP